MLKCDPHHEHYDPADDEITDFKLKRMILFADYGDRYLLVNYIECDSTFEDSEILTTLGDWEVENLMNQQKGSWKYMRVLLLSENHSASTVMYPGRQSFDHSHY